MYFHKTPRLLRRLYPGLVWHKSRKEQSIYITFDDGPCPEVTDFALEQLAKYDAKASFFCVGDNIGKFPMLFDHLIQRGHTVANHTFNHIDGWKHSGDAYLKNIKKCQAFLDRMGNDQSTGHKKLFRPPYGKIRRNQISALTPEYDIIMWDVLSGDFDQQLSAEKCLAKTIPITKNGSIVIFHDSIKAERNMRYVLPRFLEHFSNAGYQFKPL